MSKWARKKLKLSVPVAAKQPSARDAGTAETRRKLRRDQLARLLERGRIDRQQHEAGDEIRTAFATIQASLMPHRQSEVRVDRSPGHGSPIDRWSHSQERLIRRRYGPWAKAMSQPQKVSFQGRSVLVGEPLAIVMDVIWENWGPRQVDDARKLPRGLAAATVEHALARYVAMAGWKNTKAA